MKYEYPITIFLKLTRYCRTSKFTKTSLQVILLVTKILNDIYLKIYEFYVVILKSIVHCKL